MRIGDFVRLSTNNLHLADAKNRTIYSVWCVHTYFLLLHLRVHTTHYNEYDTAGRKSFSLKTPQSYFAFSKHILFAVQTYNFFCCSRKLMQTRAQPSRLSDTLSSPAIFTLEYIMSAEIA